MSNNKWEYGGLYKKHDMSGIIQVPGGTLKVHDIFEPLPDFMKQADCLFIDPPCSLGNLNTFYTKADKLAEHKTDFLRFAHRLFECIDLINPERLFIEVFKSNRDLFLRMIMARYEHVRVYETTYYHNKLNKCWVISASNKELELFPFNGMDEEDVIYYIGKHVPYRCIGDLCMGRGLVGKAAIAAGKPFVGTELNQKRLAVLVDFCKNQKKV